MNDAAMAQRGLLLSDVNLRTVADLVTNGRAQPPVLLTSAPYGQPLQIALDPAHDAWQPDLEFVVLWTTPQGVVPSFRRSLEHRVVDPRQLAQECNEYVDAIRSIADHVPLVLVPTWTTNLARRGLGPVELLAGGVERTLLEMNQRLLDGLDGISSAVGLNSGRWMLGSRRPSSTPKLWYTARVPFGHHVLEAAARDIRQALQTARGAGAKLIVLDLDDILWGGLVGEIGWDRLRLGGHDPIGEAYADFQRSLKSATRRGISLAIVSKNDESRALEAIDRHPEMVLRRADFVSWRINFADKAQNIVNLVDELRLGLDAVVFIDDSPFERGRVSEALPDVNVPEWPSEVFDFVDAFAALPELDRFATSAEDTRRTAMYVQERQRRRQPLEGISVEEWRASLRLEVRAEPASQANSLRLVQLLNKTNQMNLTTRRMAEAEMLTWALQSDHGMWGVHARDRFGDYGLIGIIGLEFSAREVNLKDFVVSCRAMGRGVEETLIYLAGEFAAERGALRLQIQYRETDRNRPCAEFLSGAGLNPQGSGRFSWTTDVAFPLPPGLASVDPRRR